jgi:hypothetical protein
MNKKNKRKENTSKLYIFKESKNTFVPLNTPKVQVPLGVSLLQSLLIIKGSNQNCIKDVGDVSVTLQNSDIMFI